MAGGILVWLAFLPKWTVTESKGDKLSVFSTGPANRQTMGNLICEAIGTALLVFSLLAILSPANLVPNSGFDKGFAPVIVGMLISTIGLFLGGPTGYAINPARDLGPHLAHFILPFPGKGSSDWGYAWIPVVGPMIGGNAGALFYKALW